MTDYYPYGMDMPGRSYTAEAYRYGYQGSEKDQSLAGGTGYTTFFRALDPRIGRWQTPDPKVFPWQSPYCSMDCNPVSLVDPWGAAAKGDGGEPAQGDMNESGTHVWGTNASTGKREWVPVGSGGDGYGSLPSQTANTPSNIVNKPSDFMLTMNEIGKRVNEMFNDLGDLISAADRNIHGAMSWSENGSGCGGSNDFVIESKNSDEAYDHSDVDTALGAMGNTSTLWPMRNKKDIFEKVLPEIVQRSSLITQEVNNLRHGNSDSNTDSAPSASKLENKVKSQVNKYRYKIFFYKGKDKGNDRVYDILKDTSVIKSEIEIEAFKDSLNTALDGDYGIEFKE